MQPAGGSIGFDRAAAFYDRTRALSPSAHAEAVDALVRELGGRGRILEIGVGTGRFALDLARRGLDLVGIDVAAAMLAELVRKSGGRPSVDLLRGDAVHLPFATGVFGGAYAVHVLHLIPAWRAAVAELVRVVRPGGVLLVDPGGARSVACHRGERVEVAREVRDAFARAAGEALARRAGLHDPSELDGVLEAAGARVRLLDPIIERGRASIGDRIRRLEDNLFSWTWSLDDETRHRAAEATRAWALDRFGSLDEPIATETPIVLRAYDL